MILQGDRDWRLECVITWHLPVRRYYRSISLLRLRKTTDNPIQVSL